MVGESGCGKTTAAHLLLRLVEPDAGRVLFDGTDITGMGRSALKKVRARLQFVPQHPRTSLNPRSSIAASIAFNMRAHKVPAEVRRRRVAELLERVGLNAEYGHRYPHQLSGGQLQRVAIARALATDPDVVVCDEAVSALDKSVQAQVLNLLADLQRDLGLALVFISHDLAVVEHLADTVAVMYLGKVVERAPRQSLWSNPRHPYTKALLSAVPGRQQSRIVLSADLPSPANPPSGCGFRTRCPDVVDVCSSAWPALTTVQPGHRVACIHEQEH
ncbi:ABC transporter ATP-binding protein [Streptomyces sp. NBC_01643]|uniref:ABC transporter ATP-binding protein n=1 Tax=Streptomyces sp. NBC_01643 TaxID=2975906 RepID=UPI00386A900D|nr:ATP-binding cassette domain-containing protein [Streptomyces sp. NBC_01643]